MKNGFWNDLVERRRDMTDEELRKDRNFMDTLTSGPYHDESGYLQLLRNVIEFGERRKNRTGTDTLSVFGPQLRFDLVDGFPLVTTKKVWWKGVAVELDWMLQGKSNTSYLDEHGVKIWHAWSRASYLPEMAYPDGELGPVYGVQWRRWTCWLPDNKNQMMAPVRVDQIAQIVDKLRHHRDDRRILLSSWNVAEIERMKLPPCHYAAQFLVDGDLGLTTIVSIRSWDLFLGAPFNIASYALLTHVLAHVSGLVPRRLVINAGDAHLYVNHVDVAKEQVERSPRGLPKLGIDASVVEVDDFRFHHAILSDYDPHPALRGEVAV
jgi:thymidylate synthase